MPLSSSNAVRQLSDGNSQGTVLGQSSADKISFYNVTPVAQAVMATTAATVTLTDPGVGSTAGVGFSTVAQFGAHVSTIRLMQADLSSLRTQLANIGLVRSCSFTRPFALAPALGAAFCNLTTYKK